ncbi:MAG: hypothetical protein ABIH92_05535 [Nanoarchaeota archaeon]
MAIKKDFGIIFWLHLILILIADSSPILFRWQLIFFGVVFLFLQQIIFQGCLLTHAQFGKDSYMTFYYKYLKLVGFRVNKKKLKFLMAWIMPVIVFLISILLQKILGIKPLLF